MALKVIRFVLSPKGRTCFFALVPSETGLPEVTRCMRLPGLISLKEVTDSAADDIKDIKNNNRALKTEVDSCEEGTFAAVGGVAFLILILLLKSLCRFVKPAAGTATVQLADVSPTDNTTISPTPTVTPGSDRHFERVLVVGGEAIVRHHSGDGPANAIEGTPAMSHRSGPASTPPRPPTPPQIASTSRFLRGVLYNVNQRP